MAERLDPAALRKVGAAIPAGTIVVGGTNGKTTTAHMIATVLAQAGRRVLHNRSGSNLRRGALAALAAQTSLSGRPHGDVAVIEADEAALPAIVAALRPRFILLNNLFRDQLRPLRRTEHHRRPLARRRSGACGRDELLVNADDPALVSVAAGVPRERVTYFGLALDPTDAGADQRLLLRALPHAADAAVCPHCGAKLAYRALYLAHLGDWHCPACGQARPALDIAARDIHLDGVTALSLTLDVRAPHAAIPLRVPLPGLYNAYNTLAAATAGLAFAVAPATIAAALGGFTAAFGRIERVHLEGRDLTLVLVKNPAGFNEVLRMLTGGAGGALANPALLAINDLDADGRDVSWLWDVDFEALAAGDAPLHTAGIRGPDMAVRLKYAGIDPARITPHAPNDLRGALLTFVRTAPVGNTLYVLPTYTAMLEIRRVLASLGAVEHFWRQ